MTARQQYINAYQQEHATTLRVLREFPGHRAEFRPHERSKSARELAWTFVVEQAMCRTALTSGFDWSQPLDLPTAPATMTDIVAAFETGRDDLVALLQARDEDITGTVSFPTAPRTLSDLPIVQFLWMMLRDHIHHRGQFSVYLRVAGGRVPSIYGPSADEPWT